LPPVGNDIVDLKEPDNCGKSGDDRFIGRVFIPEERDRIVGAACPDKLLWAFWAAKEAAYKAVSRDDPSIRSTPRRYSVALDDRNVNCRKSRVEDSAGRIAFDDQNAGKTIDAGTRSESCLTGRVITPGGVAALRVIVTDEYVHALAVAGDEDLATLVYRVDRIDVEKDAGGASAFVRRQLLLEIALRLECPIDDLAIRKERSGSGAPSVFLRGEPLAMEISLSHNGRFTAFAFQLLC
jgi:phosphopantetheine--protein transferase-like protein